MLRKSMLITDKSHSLCNKNIVYLQINYLFLKIAKKYIIKMILMNASDKGEAMLKQQVHL